MRIVKLAKLSVCAFIVGLFLAQVGAVPKSTAASNSAQFYAQSNYPILLAGESTTAYLMYKNTGTEPWYDSSSIGSNNGMVNDGPTAQNRLDQLNSVPAFTVSNPPRPWSWMVGKNAAFATPMFALAAAMRRSSRRPGSPLGFPRLA